MKRLLCLWLPDWPIQRRRIGTEMRAQDASPPPTPNAGSANPNAPSSAEQQKSADQKERSSGNQAAQDSGCSESEAGAVEGRDAEPTSANAPVILWHADPRRGRVVAAACPRALGAGVRLGMPIAQAADLAAMTDAVLEPYDRDADRAALQSLAIELQTHLSPQTAVETLERFKWSGRFRHDPEAILLEIQGVTHLFADKDAVQPDPADHPNRSGELGLLSASASILARRNLWGRFAIADTIGAAWALANHAASQGSAKKRSGAFRGAGDFGGNDEIRDRHQFFVAPPGRSVEALQTLPCAALRLQPDIVATLDRLGVATIGSLLRLPREGLATRLGPALCQRIAQATGEVDESLVAIESQCEHAAMLDLEYPTDAIDLLADRLTRLIGQSTEGLSTLRRGVLRLRCQLDFTQHPPVVLETGLFAPTLDQTHLTGLMLGALEAVRFGSKVTRMTVGVAQHAPLSSRQPSIFGPDFAASSNEDWTSQTEAARLIDALAGRLGEDAVRGVRVSDDPLPENSIEDYPLTSHRLKAEARKAKRASRQPTMRQRAADDAMQRDAAPPGRVAGVHDQTHGNGSAHGGGSGRLGGGFGSGPQTTDLGRRPIELHEQPHAITPLENSVPTNGSSAQGVSVTGPGGGFPTRFRIRGRVEKVCQHWGPERIETRWWRGPLIRRDYFRIELENGARLWIYYDLGDGTGRVIEDEKRWYLHGRFA
ncbi:protein ImuB [Rhodopirellula rubra]|uniref:Protein ImuB n=1 Tax=Aporhodopirellula rubra TaxID=980271 RepID=A0A7W5E0D2_9BACT|nr:DNA polymerase Y family protein [Aporhodopirellula rubra]MBB3207795.1 protein ImuB [Aporhodopirellula rubra]